MTTRTREPRISYPTTGRTAGVVSAVMGVLALVGTGWVVLISTVDVDVAEWLRVAGSTLVPVGLVGAVIAGFLGWRGPVTGVVLAVATVLSFAVAYSLLD
jgi:hypothetical protein